MGERLTLSQLADMKRAILSPLGVVDTGIGWGGLQRASWHAKMSRLVSAGLMKPYVHGGYEITGAGRARLELEGRLAP